jgi:mitochondrial distribution and morphology protein 12
MSLDLAWDKLDGPLAQRLVDILNKQLASMQRPSFIGPIEVTGLDFGTVCPDIELVDMRDIYRDFLEDSDSSDGKGGSDAGLAAQDEDYEWVSRRDADLNRAAAFDSHLPQHRLFGLPPGPGGMTMSVPNLADMRPGIGLGGFPGLHARGGSLTASMYASPLHTPYTSALRNSFINSNSASPSPAAPGTPDSLSSNQSSLDPDTPATAPQLPPMSSQPDIQLHFRVLHHSDLRLSLTTSLLINYPSPMFLSLPIKLTVTGLEFTGEVVVAYEGASPRRRVHFCLLDDLDPYGLATSQVSSSSGEDRDGDLGAAASKPLPIGQRLLPSIFIESEIGQADNHVLRNVTRVERFIQDAIRKTVEDELVFPNFHTLVLNE